MKRKIAVVLGIAGILLTIIGILIDKMEQAAAISIIGGADGPTSVFVAGKVGTSGFGGIFAAGIGIILIVIAVIKVISGRKNHQNKGEDQK